MYFTIIVKLTSRFNIIKSNPVLSYLYKKTLNNFIVFNYIKKTIHLINLKVNVLNFVMEYNKPPKNKLQEFYFLKT